jgi:hypothetical protein
LDFFYKLTEIVIHNTFINTLPLIMACYGITDSAALPDGRDVSGLKGSQEPQTENVFGQSAVSSSLSMLPHKKLWEMLNWQQQRTASIIGNKGIVVLVSPWGGQVVVPLFEFYDRDHSMLQHMVDDLGLDTDTLILPVTVPECTQLVLDWIARVLSLSHISEKEFHGLDETSYADAKKVMDFLFDCESIFLPEEARRTDRKRLQFVRDLPVYENDLPSDVYDGYDPLFIYGGHGRHGGRGVRDGYGGDNFILDDLDMLDGPRHVNSYREWHNPRFSLNPYGQTADDEFEEFQRTKGLHHEIPIEEHTGEPTPEEMDAAYAEFVANTDLGTRYA